MRLYSDYRKLIFGLLKDYMLIIKRLALDYKMDKLRSIILQCNTNLKKISYETDKKNENYRTVKCK